MADVENVGVSKVLEGREERKEERTLAREKNEVMAAANEILADYGVEGNIPVGSEYWDLRNQYRALLTKV